MARKGGDLWRRDPRPGMLVLIAGVALLLFLGLVLAVMISPAFAAADERLSEAFRDLNVPAFDALFGAVTHLGDFGVMFAMVTIACLVLWALRRRTDAVLLAAVMVVGPSIGAATKDLVERARPSLEFARIALPESYSFPSGHALATFLFFGTLAYIVILNARTVRARTWTVAVCSTLIVLVGMSRVYLGVHWFGDISASWILGFGIMSLATALYLVVTMGEPEGG